MELKYFYKIDNDKLVKGSGYKIPTGFIEYDITNKPDEFLQFDIEDNKTKLKSNLSSYCKNKLQDIKNYLAERKVDKEDEDRYNYKYQLAIKVKNGDEEAKSKLQLEADIQSITVDELVDLIITKHDEWVATIETYSQRIEAFRIAFNKQIDEVETLEDIKLLEYKEKIAQDFDINTTDEDIVNLLNLTEIPTN